MTECGNYFLSSESFTTNRTLNACGKTGRSTCCIYCRNSLFGMTESRNFCLSYKNFITYGAVLTFSKTGVGTIGSYCLVNYFGVTSSSNSFLSYKNFITYRAVLTFSKTGVGTIGSNRCVNYFGVRKLIYCLCCCAELCITYRAVNYFVIRAFCLTSSGNNIFLNCLACGMTECGNYFLSSEDFTTNRTLNASGKTGSGTCCAYCRNSYFGVTLSCSFICNVAVVASGTSIGCITAVYAIGSGYNRIVGVTCCRNFILSSEGFTTNGAVASLSETGVGTIGSNRFINYFGMTKSINRYVSRIVTVVSTADLVSIPTDFGTGGSLCADAYDSMAERSDSFFISAKHYVTFGTVNNRVVTTCFCTGG